MKYKLVCFDLDGTLVDGTEYIWQTIHKFLGTDSEARRKASEDFHEGRISYKEWFEHDIRLWNDVGANKDSLIEAIKNVRPHEGALETLQKLKHNNFRIAVISGSIDLVLKNAFGIHQSLFDDVFINKIFFADGGRIAGGEHTPFDMEHKATGLRKIAEKDGLELSECVFVGDNDNDVEIAQAAGLSIAFNCNSDALKEVVDVVVEGKDMKEILQFIMKE